MSDNGTRRNLQVRGPNRFARSAWRFARPVVVCYLLVVVMVMIFERSLVYPIPPLSRGDWKPAWLGHEDVWFTSADGTQLHGWFVPHPAARQAIVYFHGNAEQVGDNAELMAHLRDALEASVFIFDYRGYGHSQGRPDEAGCIADGRAAQRWLADRMGLQPNEVVLMGRSLGGGVAVALASEVGAKALVLENTFPTAIDIAALHFPWLPVRWLMNNRYDSITRIRQYQGPLFQIHGGNDQLVPLEFGRRLFDAAPHAKKRFLAIPGLEHNDAWPASYYQELARFLEATTTSQVTRADKNAGEGVAERRVESASN